MNGEENTLIILMTGLCAFVPREDIEKSPKDNQVCVLLVESTTSMDLPGMGMSYTHEQHVPVLLAPYGNVDSSPGYRQPDLIFGRKDVEWAVFLLDQQDLGVDGAQSHRLEIVGSSGAGIGCPDHQMPNLNAFEWIADFARISPDAEYVDKACLEPEGDPAVVARVELWQGKIFTDLLCLDEKLYPVLWKYKMPDSPKRGPEHYQAAAAIVGFETHFGDAVVLLTRKFGEKDGRRIRLFIPKNEKADAENKKVEIWVKNMPWADILAARPREGYRYKPDIHFSHLYKICQDYNSVNVPHFYRSCPEQVDASPHAGNPNCQPVRTAPNPEA
jgi:hypothetical protein